MSARSIVAQTSLFGGLSAEQLDALADRLRPRVYRKGAVVFSEGDAGTTMYFIEKGEVKLTIMSADGEEVILALLGPGGFFGELAVLDGGRRSATAVARCDGKLMTLDREDLLQFLEQHAKAAASLLAALSRRLRRTTDLVHDAAFLDGPTRLAKTLMQLDEIRSRSSPDGVLSAPRLTQAELAELVGGTRESVNRWLRVLARAGLVRARRGMVTIADAQKLRERFP